MQMWNRRQDERLYWDILRRINVNILVYCLKRFAEIHWHPGTQWGAGRWRGCYFSQKVHGKGKSNRYVGISKIPCGSLWVLFFFFLCWVASLSSQWVPGRKSDRAGRLRVDPRPRKTLSANQKNTVHVAERKKKHHGYDRIIHHCHHFLLVGNLHMKLRGLTSQKMTKNLQLGWKNRDQQWPPKAWCWKQACLRLVPDSLLGRAKRP